MDLAQTMTLLAGGEGSGCNPKVAKPRCGRPKKKGSATELGKLGAPGSSSKIHKNRGVDGGYYSNGHKVDVFRSGRKIGEAGVLEHRRVGKKIWTVYVSRVNDNLVGKGFGKYLYKEIIRQALINDVDVLQSDRRRGSKGSEHAWQRIAEQLPAEKDKGRWRLPLGAV